MYSSDKSSSGIKNLILAATLFMSLGFQSCATYQYKVGEARNLISQGQYSEAANKLENLAKTPAGDQLIYLLDYALALQLAGRYEESVEALLLADELAEFKDYHSISKIASSLLINEEMVQYKGENFEKVLINAFLAINFVMLGKTEEALVETRRLNEKLEKLKLDGMSEYEQNEFAQYLSAVLWESNKNWDDAYIAYERFYHLYPDFPLIGQDLVRAARNARRNEELIKWKEKFPGTEVDNRWFDPGYGELIIIYQQGWGPRKQFHPDDYRYPVLVPTSSLTQGLKVEIDGHDPVFSARVHSVTHVAMKTMNEYYGQLIAKKIAALATKAIVAEQIRQQNSLLGDLAWIAMNLSDRADLRQWSTLPESFQVVRVMLPVGKHKIHLQGINEHGGPTHEGLNEIEIEIKPRQKTFYSWRSLN